MMSCEMEEDCDMGGMMGSDDDFGCSNLNAKPPVKCVEKGMRMFSKQNLFEEADLGYRATELQKLERFEEPEQTSEYMETHYYQVTDLEAHKSLVPLNSFWGELAHHLADGQKTKFITSSFLECHTSEREMLLCMAFLELAIDISGEPSHLFEPDESIGVRVTPGANLMIFRREIRDCALQLEAAHDIIVTHRYRAAHQSEKE